MTDIRPLCRLDCNASDMDCVCDGTGLDLTAPAHLLDSPEAASGPDWPWMCALYGCRIRRWAWLHVVGCWPVDYPTPLVEGQRVLFH